ncbi:MAG TPA: hypothetical protein VGH53_12415, partial [Streptosporangiaceae bacterium]
MPAVALLRVSTSPADPPSYSNTISGPLGRPLLTSGVTVAGTVLLVALLAGVAIWSGWVGLGSLCDSGMVEPVHGIDGSRWQPW